jgi:hypothetical protein
MSEQFSKTDNNALEDSDAVYNLEKHNLIYHQIKCKFSMASHYAKTT